MARPSPSLLALLGLAAVAGYQNRGRISEMLRAAGDDADTAPRDDLTGARPPVQRSFLAGIGDLFGAEAGGGTLADGLRDLVGRFRDAGRPDPADSWVSRRENLPADPADLQAALGADTLEELGRKTGLSPDEVLRRLGLALPEVVNRLTPEGRLPTESEARDLI